MELPKKDDLPVNLLAACFNNTSATYKFYWFLSIIQTVESGKTKILKRDLFARMISNAWFTVNYFHVSFGKQDRLQRAIEAVKNFERLMIDDDREKIFKTLAKTSNKDSVNQLQYFNNQVPHWFLSPWFPKISRTEIYIASQSFRDKCLYALLDEEIQINPEWEKYLLDNARVLKDFCYWNLAIFLQAKNPNVPDIPNKLIKPAIRSNLARQRAQFWDLVIKELGSVQCIYTNEKLTIGNYAVEHFIPYNFVSHNLIWNLIPANRTFNSSKSDKLPPLEKYFNPFFTLQKTAIEIVRKKTPKNKFLEDYLTIFSDLDEVNNLPLNFTKEKFKERIQPLITIASNNGFEFLK
jgi:5-methylcytosine-specific restriction endonuclease McrA